MLGEIRRNLGLIPFLKTCQRIVNEIGFDEGVHPRFCFSGGLNPLLKNVQSFGDSSILKALLNKPSLCGSLRFLVRCRSLGLERILEDVLDPNRNVDINFRTQIIVLKEGDVMTGQARREEGELLVIADSTGKEISIPKKQIESRRESETSLMPANFGDIIPEKEFQDLMAFLLSKGVPRGE